MNLRESVQKELCLKDREDRIAGKAFNSVSHCNLVQKFISHAPGDENSGCENSSGRRMEEARKVASLANDQSKEQKVRSSWKHKKSQEQSILPR